MPPNTQAFKSHRFRNSGRSQHITTDKDISAELSKLIANRVNYDIAIVGCECSSESRFRQHSVHAGQRTQATSVVLVVDHDRDDRREDKEGQRI
jgi:hypothetical protein